MSRSLGISELMEGTLELALRKWKAIGGFIAANGALSYGALWLEVRYGLDEVWAIGLILVIATLTNSALVLALGGRLSALLADPIELFTRIVFALATYITMIIGVVIGIFLLIVPGFYVFARWTIALPLVLLDGSEIIEGLRRSWNLTRDSAWALVGANVLLAVLALLATLSEPTLSDTALLVFHYVLTSLVDAFLSVMMVFVYLELIAPPNPADELPDNPA
jgi:hypothetical protein